MCPNNQFIYLQIGAKRNCHIYHIHIKGLIRFTATLKSAIRIRFVIENIPYIQLVQFEILADNLYAMAAE
jgi:hypothetical protein